MKRFCKQDLLLSLTLLLLVPGTAAYNEETADSVAPPVCSAWAQEEIARAETLHLLYPGLPQDYRAPIIQMDFCQMALTYAAAQCGRGYDCFLAMVLEERVPHEKDGEALLAFEDCEGEEALAATAAHHLGIVYGKTPEQLTLRASSLARRRRSCWHGAYEAVGGCRPWKGEDAFYSIEYYFKDSAEVGPWAKNDVATVAYWKVMNGVSEGIFAPEGTFSIEQCAATFLRLWDRNPDGWTAVDPE